jgi:hypothetical protein
MNTKIVTGSLSLLLLACGGSKQTKAATAADAETKSATPVAGAGASSLCPAVDATHEMSEYDTSGDAVPDVRKIFLRIGQGSIARLVLVCRESDINYDGTKDVVRQYTDEGRPLRETADTNFDGKMDSITFYQEGAVIRQEIDSKRAGKVDTKIFFEGGKPLRAERDLVGRSTTDKWQPDRWEYYEEGHMMRMGTDLDGDGKVDRWDRDATMKRAPSVDSGAADSSDGSDA